MMWDKNNPRHVLNYEIIKPDLVQRKTQLIRGKNPN